MRMTAAMTRNEMSARFDEFPGPIRALGYQLPKVARIMDMYARGDIITLQEALCKMVVELGTETESQRKQMMDWMNSHAFTTIIPAQSPNAQAHRRG